jgi:hypothetical protein
MSNRSDHVHRHQQPVHIEAQHSYACSIDRMARHYLDLEAAGRITGDTRENQHPLCNVHGFI